MRRPLSTRTLPVLALLLLAPPAALRAQAPAPDPLDRLRILIGVWDVEDVYRPIQGAEIREVGVRTCAWVMRNRYVECVTVGRNASGREREYRWFINHNAETRRYEMVQIFSNVPLKLQQTIQIDSAGAVWHIRSPPYAGGGVEQWSGAELRFDGRDRAVWTGYRNLATTPIGEWAQSTRETWVRRPPRPDR